MESVHGSKIIYMYRPLNAEAKKSAALRLAFVKENGKTVSTDADTTQTKDGTLRSPSQAEIEITSTSVLASDDTMISLLEKAQLNNEKVEVWEINLDKPGTTDGKYKGTYYQAYVTEIEKSSPSDDWTEMSLTFGIEGKGAEGDVTVPANMLDEALYTFTDTTAQAE